MASFELTPLERAIRLPPSPRDRSKVLRSCEMLCILLESLPFYSHLSDSEWADLTLRDFHERWRSIPAPQSAAGMVAAREAAATARQAMMAALEEGEWAEEDSMESGG